MPVKVTLYFKSNSTPLSIVLQEFSYEKTGLTRYMKWTNMPTGVKLESALVDEVVAILTEAVSPDEI